MAAQTQDRSITVADERATAKANLLLSGETVYMGSVCMVTSAGKVRRVTTGVANCKVLGAAKASYSAPGADTAQPMIFRRGVIGLNGKAGNLPTEANLMTLIRLVNDNEVSNEAIGANDQSVKLISIEDGIFYCEVL